MGTGGIAAGGVVVLEAFSSELAAAQISATVEKKCTVHKVGCRGLCAKDVLVDVIIDGVKTTYEHINPAMVQRIVTEHLVGGTAVAEWAVKDDYTAFHSKQVKVVLADCGVVDPESIDSYIEAGGYQAIKKVLSSLTPEETALEIKKSGLRGRGGAGFPTGVKWETCRTVLSDTKYIICNADEGDPGAFMDRAALEGNPHAVLEGMIIGAYAIGAHIGYVYVRAEYPLAVERLTIAIRQATDRGYLGENILETGFTFNVRIKLGAGAFVCGEETALIASIEGERGMPRPKPPFPVFKGLWGKPTVINNVETLANIPHIIQNGAAWFSSYGTEKSRGTKVFSLTGKVRNTGLIEVPMGITLREIIHEIGGGIEHGRQCKAVQAGGPSGGCIPASMFDLSVDYESLSKAGAIIGSGGMIVLDEDDCMVSMAKYFLQFTQTESCGKCVPCRVGTKRMLEIMERIVCGDGCEGDLDHLMKLGNDIRQTSLCGLGMTAPNPVLSTIRYFRDEYEAHIRDKKCPSHVCKDLVTFSILTEPCNGCGACLRACPANAVTGERKKLHSIDQTRCVRCGACFDACKFKAVAKI
ncbi:MAG: NADH-quinone oxidoreductase subunit F [Nitrospirae bacterium]|nr:MAG: NADH-quinone oxidoreductase subunit F [Nitrospirota bacterium]